MKKTKGFISFFSWALVICFIFMMIIPIIFGEVQGQNIDTRMNLLLIILGLCSLGLLGSIIMDRIKQKKEENPDDYNKY